MRRNVAAALIPILIFLPTLAQCGSTSDAPQGQVLLFIDTDAPAASQAIDNPRLLDAMVDTLRIDVLGDTTVLESKDVTAPDASNWPISFGVKSTEGRSIVRLRLRAFRAQRASIAIVDGNRVLEPTPSLTIDRVVEVPIPQDKGVLGLRVVLHSDCRGHRPDFVRWKTCVTGEPKDEEGIAFRNGLEAVDPDIRPESLNISYNSPEPGEMDCNLPCPENSICIPGGFFVLGNQRVVGFDRNRDAVPPHPVLIKPFCIDKTEFTVANYKGKDQPIPTSDDSHCFCYKDSNSPHGLICPEDHNELPMNCVSWQQANQACHEVDGRLPTEAEWEYVATGMGKGTLFPWGDSPPTCETSALGRVDDMLELLPECESTEMIRVTEPMGDRVSVSGHDEVWQMGGSVSEWTFDSFTPYWNTETDNNCWQKQGVFLHPFCELDTRPVCEEHYPSSNMADLSFTVRGGNFIDPLSHAYSALRRSERGGTQSPKIGFRCVYFPGQNDPKSKVRPNSDSQSGDVECAGDGP